MNEYALGWGSLAVMNAALANASGRGSLKYFLGSFFLGPIITIILAATYEDSQGHLHLSELWKGDKATSRNQPL